MPSTGIPINFTSYIESKVNLIVLGTVEIVTVDSYLTLSITAEKLDSPNKMSIYAVTSGTVVLSIPVKVIADT